MEHLNKKLLSVLLIATMMISALSVVTSMVSATEYDGSTSVTSGGAMTVETVNDIKYGDLTVSKVVAGNAGDKNKDFSFTLRIWNEINETDVASKKINYYAVDANDYSDYNVLRSEIKNKSIYKPVGSKDFTTATYDNIVDDVSRSVSPDDPSAGPSCLDYLWTENASPELEIDFTNNGESDSKGFTYTGGVANTISLTPASDEINVYFVYDIPDFSGNVIVKSIRSGYFGLFILRKLGAGLNALSAGGIQSLQDGVGNKGSGISIDFNDFTDEQLKELASASGMNFALKDNQSLTIKNIPVAYKYEIVEEDYTKDGYTTTKENDSGVIIEDSAVYATFTNTKNNTSVITDPDKPVTPDPETPVITDPNKPVTPDPETPVITDPNNPVTPDPKAPVVPDPNVTKRTTPKTGDHTNILLWGALLGSSLIIYLGARLAKRKIRSVR